MKLSDYVMQKVAEAGVKHVFIVPGGGAMHLNDSLGRRSDLEFVCNLHEHGAAVAAEAYGKVTNNLGVALVTTGPGSTNCVTGVSSAWVNSSPVLFLSGQVKRSDLKGNKGLRQLGLQEIDIVSVVQPITKLAKTVTDPSTIRRDLEEALHVARSGRFGPVWLDLPLDVQAADIDPEKLEGYVPDPVTAAPDLAGDVAEVLAWLDAAERPIVLAGCGIRYAGATQALITCMERLGVPVATTWNGADLIAEDHPLYAGRPGAFATRGANFAVQNCDLLLTIGARWDFGTTGFAPANFGRAARRVVVDTDPAEIAKLGSVVTKGIVAGADQFLAELERQIASRSIARPTSWTQRCRAWLEKYPMVTEDMRTPPSGTSTYVFVDRLGQLLGEGDVIVEGSAGVHAEIFYMTFPVKRGQRVITDGSYGAMGYGVPAVLGACLARGGRTVLVDGDGSFMPNVQELQVISRLNLPIKLFVVNNDGYSSIRVSQMRWFENLVGADTTSGLTLPSLPAVAAAFGLPCITIANHTELDAKLRAVLDHAGPIICEVIVPRDEDRVPRMSNYRKADGTMASKPIEDLFPFLDRDEFRTNMIIDPLPE